VPGFPDERPIILFDGHCVLCSAWARFVLGQDTAARYRLLPAQTRLGEALYRHYGLNSPDYETNVLIEEGLAWFKSEGTIRMFEGLGFPWSLLRILRVVPEAVRDRLYDLIARNRLKLFGRREACFLAEPGQEERFLR
jgi:predicted DCC family thiol-disulfide oxidoreductase YuxK